MAPIRVWALSRGVRYGRWQPRREFTDRRIEFRQGAASQVENAAEAFRPTADDTVHVRRLDLTHHFQPDMVERPGRIEAVHDVTVPILPADQPRMATGFDGPGDDALSVMAARASAAGAASPR